MGAQISQEPLARPVTPRDVFWLATIVLVAAMLYFVWPGHWMYRTGQGGVVVRIDRLTGAAEYLDMENGWVVATKLHMPPIPAGSSRNDATLVDTTDILRKVGDVPAR